MDTKFNLTAEQLIRSDAAEKATRLHVGQQSSDETIVNTADALAKFIADGTVIGRNVNHD